MTITAACPLKAITAAMLAGRSHRLSILGESLHAPASTSAVILRY